MNGVREKTHGDVLFGRALRSGAWNTNFRKKRLKMRIIFGTEEQAQIPSMLKIRLLERMRNGFAFWKELKCAYACGSRLVFPVIVRGAGCRN